MRANKIQIDQFASAVHDILSEYTQEVTDVTKEVTRETGKLDVKQIKETAPRSKGKTGGKYAKSWNVKTVLETPTKLATVVHSPTRYMLAHLLEYGHAKRGGGRVRAIPHLEPAEQAGIEYMEKELERRLGN